MKTVKRISILITVFVLLLSTIPTAFAENDKVTANGINNISKYGNLELNVTQQDILSKFECGDILTATFGKVSVDVPLCTAFSNVDMGYPGLFLQTEDNVKKVVLAVNLGSFAEKYGVAKSQVKADDSLEWIYNEGYSSGTTFEFTMKEKAGYLEEYLARRMSYTDKRSDYPNLTDAEFANFRMVKMGNIGEGVLYRMSSPVNTVKERYSYAEAEAKKAGVNVFIDLEDSEDELKTFKNYNDTYFSKTKHIAVAATMDPKSDDNKKKIAEGMRFIINNPGVYGVHCKEGKERTGYFIALLECLMGASYKEVARDYMTSYRNFFGISEEDPSYELITNGNIYKTLANMFDTDPQIAKLDEEAYDYLIDIGLSDKEISRLKCNLAGKHNYKNGKCVLCGYEEPTTTNSTVNNNSTETATDTITGNPETGVDSSAIIALIVATVTLLICVLTVDIKRR